MVINLLSTGIHMILEYFFVLVFFFPHHHAYRLFTLEIYSNVEIVSYWKIF